MKRLLLAVAMLISGLVMTADAQTIYQWRYREHATNCPAITDGKKRDLCYEIDSERYFKCQPATGEDCDSSDDWEEFKSKLLADPTGCDPGEFVIDISDTGVLTCDPAASSTLTTSSFNNRLSASEDTAQEAFDRLDDIILVNASDCPALTSGRAGDICIEDDDGTMYRCDPSIGQCDTAGEWKPINTTGNAATATALAANGTNASSGNAILGVDAAGNAEGAFDVWTEAENTSAGYISASSSNTLTNKTISAASNVVEADTGDSADSFFSAGDGERARGMLNADTSAYGAGLIGSDASNNTIDVDTLNELATALGQTVSDLCALLTGSADLCDGSDDGAGGSGGATVTVEIDDVTSMDGTFTLNVLQAYGVVATESPADQLNITGTNVFDLIGNASTASAMSGSGQIDDNDLAAGAVDGGNAGEIADGSITADDLGTDSVSADELNATGVETELEAALDIAGEVSSTGMGSTVIADSVSVTGWNLTTATLTGLTTVSTTGTLAQRLSDKHIVCTTFTAGGIQACIDALGSSGGKVELIDGVYTVATTITTPVRVDVNITIEGHGKNTLLNCTMTDGSDCFVVAGAASDAPSRAYGIVMRNFYMEGNASSGDGIFVNNVSQSKFDNLWVFDFGGYGVRGDVTTQTEFNHIVTQDNTAGGLIFEHGHDFSINNNTGWKNDGPGLSIGVNYECTVSGNQMQYNDDANLYVFGDPDLEIAAPFCTFTGNNFQSEHASEDTSHIVLENVWNGVFIGNVIGRSTGATEYAIKLTNSYRNVFIGNHAEYITNFATLVNSSENTFAHNWPGQTIDGANSDFDIEMDSDSHNNVLVGNGWQSDQVLFEMERVIINSLSSLTAGSNVTASTESTGSGLSWYQWTVGNSSGQLDIASGFTTGVVGYVNVSATDLSDYTHVGFWIMAESNVSAGVLDFCIDDTNACASPLQSTDLPALTAYAWKYVVVPLSDPTALTSVLSLGLTASSDPGVVTLYLDTVSGQSPKGLVDISSKTVSFGPNISMTLDGTFTVAGSIAADQMNVDCEVYDATAWNTSTKVACMDALRDKIEAISGSAAAGGSNTEVQFNSGGSLDGITGVTTDGESMTVTTTLTIEGSLNLGSDLCAGLDNGGALTTDANGKVVCEDDDSGGGSSSGYIYLNPGSASITGTLAVVGDATQGAQIDGSNGQVLLFDATTDEGAAWRVQLPDNWASHTSIRIPYSMTSATSGTVEFEIAIMCQTPGDSERDDADGFAAIAVAADTVPGTARFPDAVTVTPTDDGCAASDNMTIFLSTDSDDGTNDTATGDRRVNAPLVYEYGI